MTDAVLPPKSQPFPPCRLGLRGSFVIAAICRDGIVLVSETRANIFDKTDPDRRPIAYHDRLQKIFPIGLFAMAETGQGLILNVFFSAIVENFTNAITRPFSVDQLLPDFIRYCEQSFPAEFAAHIRAQKLFAAGCLNNRPRICYFNLEQDGKPTDCLDKGFIESASTTLLVHAHELHTLSAAETAALAKRAIQLYADVGDRWKTIGGPFDVLLVAKTGCRWFEKNSVRRNWKYTKDLIRDYQHGRLELSLIPPATTKQLAALFASESGID